MHNQRPFIIWTLQRTGGTNICASLTARSSCPSLQHEPFNGGRVFGRITEHWIAHRNQQALDEAIAEICSRGVLIKHCVDTVPWEVSETLARSAVAVGYRHVVLSRRNSLDRLLSLHFAEQTGIWGPDMRRFIAITGAHEADATASPAGVTDQMTAAHPLPVERLVRHEVLCRKLLQQAWRRLRSLGAVSHDMCFEDIYLAESGAARTELAALLDHLALSRTVDDDALWMDQVLTQGEQGTRARYRDFPGMNELRKRLTDLPLPLPGDTFDRVVWRNLANGHSSILRCFVDVLPEAVQPDADFDIGGVVVLSGTAQNGLILRLAGEDRELPLQWDHPSQRMAQEHPDGRNSAHARWSGRVCFTGQETSFAVELVAPDGTVLPVAEILRNRIEDSDDIHVEPDDRLIFDIGTNDGADTRYYLRKGFRVVAAEAIPDLADALRTRFAAQIAAGRLIVEQQAVTCTPGQSELTINQDWTEWSSAHQAGKAFAGAHRTITVPAVTLAALITQYGQPYYIKIDIEGGELDAVGSLTELPVAALPSYISVETNQHIFAVLQVLWSLGYRAFQLVRQGERFLPTLPRPSREGLDYRTTFTSNMSGPFGRDLPDQGWVGLVDIIRRLIASQAEMRERTGRRENPGWYDVHARRPSAA